MDKYRLKKYKKGWIVEVRVNYFVFNKWFHVTSYSGLPNDPFYYKTPEGAIDGALRTIKEEIIFNYKFN